MRAREFVVNMPIKIKVEPFLDDLDMDDDEIENRLVKVEKRDTVITPVSAPVQNRPVVAVNNNLPPKDASELDPNPVMVPPLQQQIEIDKAAVGKTSPVIDELTQDEEDPEDETEN